MSNNRKIKHSASSSPENEQTKVIPEKEKPRRHLAALLWLCGALALLGVAVHALVTGNTLLMEKKVRAVPARWGEVIGYGFFSLVFFSIALDSYNPGLKRRIGAFLSAPLFLCGGLALLAYAVYGLATNNLRMLVFGGFASSGGIFLFGLPVFVLFLAYLSLSSGLISVAAVRWMKNGALSEKIDKLGDKAFVAALILYIGAAVLANKMNLHH